MAIILVLVTEMLNTAIEVAVDMIAEEYHPKAKIAKDIAAGVVLVASVGALILAYLILYPALREAWQQGLWQLRKAPHDVIAFVSLAVVVIAVVFIKAVLGKGRTASGGYAERSRGGIVLDLGRDHLSFRIVCPSIALTFILAAMVSWSRWSSGVHQPREVFAGAFLGAG